MPRHLGPCGWLGCIISPSFTPNHPKWVAKPPTLRGASPPFSYPSTQSPDTQKLVKRPGS